MPVLDDTLTWKGTWAAGVDYVEDDAVLDADKVYVCIDDHTSALANRAPAALFWELLVDTPATAYATVALYRSLIDKSDDADDSIVTDDLEAVSRYLDKRLGRSFVLSDAPTPRVYVPKSTGRPTRSDWAESENPWKYGGLSRVLDIDDLVSVTEIAVDESMAGTYSRVLEATDYELLPRNAAVLQEPEPYKQIEATSWGSLSAWAPRARVRVTGIWGWPAVPQPIVRATVQLTAILRLESPRATRSIDEMGTVLGMSRDGAGIVDDLVRHYTRFSL